MAAIGIFIPGIDTEQDVLEIRNQVITTLKSGGMQVTSWSSEGTSVNKIQGMKLEDILDECNYFLQRIGVTNKSITRTTARFY